MIKNKEYDKIIYILEDYRSLMAEAGSAEVSLKLSIRDYVTKHHDDPKLMFYNYKTKEYEKVISIEMHEALVLGSETYDVTTENEFIKKANVEFIMNLFEDTDEFNLEGENNE